MYTKGNNGDGKDDVDDVENLLLSPPLELLLLLLLFFSGDLLRLRLSLLLVSLGLLDLDLLSFFFPFLLSSLLYSFLFGELERDLSRSYLYKKDCC